MATLVTSPSLLVHWAPRLSSHKAVHKLKHQTLIARGAASKTAETVDKYFRAVLNLHDLDVLEEIAAADVVFSDRVWSQRDAVGIKKLRKVHQKLLDAYPDYSVHVDSLLSREDSRVAMAHWTATGTFGQGGADRGAGSDDGSEGDPSMRSVISGVSMFLVAEGGSKIREIIVYRQALEEEQHLHRGTWGGGGRKSW